MFLLLTVYPNVTTLEEVGIALICFGMLGFLENDKENY